MDYRPSWNLRSIPDDVFFSQPGRHAAMRVNLGGLREGAGRQAIIVPCPHAGSRKRRRKRDGATDARASAYGRVGRPLRTFAGFSDAACVIARSCRCALNADRLRLPLVVQARRDSEVEDDQRQIRATVEILYIWRGAQCR
jgi:hypothetical protein